LFGLLFSVVAFADTPPEPTFDCSVTPDIEEGEAVVIHSNAVPVDETKLVTLKVHTSRGWVDVQVCGSTFKTASTQKLAFKKPASDVKGFHYWCKALQSQYAQSCSKSGH